MDQGSTAATDQGSTAVDLGSANQPTSQQPAPTGRPTSAGLSDFLYFRYMITPPLITVLWVVSVVAITIAALAALNSSVLGAIVGWALGMIWVRVVFEVMIVLFRINDGIQTIARRR